MKSERAFLLKMSLQKVFSDSNLKLKKIMNGPNLSNKEPLYFKLTEGYNDFNVAYNCDCPGDVNVEFGTISLHFCPKKGIDSASVLCIQSKESGKYIFKELDKKKKKDSIQKIISILSRLIDNGILEMTFGGEFFLKELDLSYIMAFYCLTNEERIFYGKMEKDAESKSRIKKLAENEFTIDKYVITKRAISKLLKYAGDFEEECRMKFSVNRWIEMGKIKEKIFTKEFRKYFYIAPIFREEVRWDRKCSKYDIVSFGVNPVMGLIFTMGRDDKLCDELKRSISRATIKIFKEEFVMENDSPIKKFRAPNRAEVRNAHACIYKRGGARPDMWSNAVNFNKLLAKYGFQWLQHSPQKRGPQRKPQRYKRCQES